MRDFQLVVIKLSGSSRLNVARAFMRVAGLIKNNFITNGVIRGIRGSRISWLVYAMGSHIFTRDISARDAAFRDSVPENYSIIGLDYRSIFAICVYAIHAQPSFLHARKARVRHAK